VKTTKTPGKKQIGTNILCTRFFNQAKVGNKYNKPLSFHLNNCSKPPEGGKNYRARKLWNGNV